MGFSSKTGISLASGFKYQAESPLDLRRVVDTIADRDELVTIKAAWEGMHVYVKADKKTYEYRGGSTWTPVLAGTMYSHPTYTAKANGLYKVTVDGTGHVSGTTAVTKADITGLGIPAKDTTYSAFKAATADAAGGTGLVPAPAKGAQGQYLRADGSWATPTNTTYADATTSAHGLMTAADKTKLNGIETGANKYTHPSSHALSMITETDTLKIMTAAERTKLAGIAEGANKYVHPAYTARTAGFNKLTIDATGHVSGVTAVTKADITALGIPASNTWRGIQDNLTSTATDQSLSAAKGKWLNENKAGITTLTNEDLDKITTPGFYNAGGGNSVTNKPGGVDNFGMIVVHSASGSYYTQIVYYSDKSYRRVCSNGAWGSWSQDVFTDTKYTHPSYTAKSSGLYKITVDGTGHISAATAVTKADITGLGIPSTNTTYGIATTSADGLMSKSDKSKLDGVAANANNYTHPSSHALSMITETDDLKIMTAAERTKLAGIAEGANKYTHPSYTARTAGLYKITVDATGHVSAVTAVAKADITALGIPSTNTTYSTATSSAAGLMSAADKAKLDGIAEKANNYTYTHPNSGVTAGTYKSVTVNAQGHITAGTNPTTLAGYGITDAAKSVHTHKAADITDNIPASKISGVLSIDNIPKAALERQVPVADDTARFKLTTDDVQNGDVVKVTSTGLMYFVTDQTKLNSADGYMEFTAGSAASVPWTGVTGKPSTFTPSSHKHAIADITSLQDALNGKAANKNMTAATASAAGAAGLVPAPGAGKQGQYLRGDGTWATPTNTTYSDVTTSVHGLMTAADKVKLNGIAANANNYTHPSSHSLDMITETTAKKIMTADERTKLAGIAVNANNYTHPSSHPASMITETDSIKMMTAAERTKLAGIATGANNYTHPSYTARTSGLYKITVDATGHVSAATAVTKDDITGLGIPASNTWRGIQNNLTSTATDQSLSAYQGKLLNDKVNARLSRSEWNCTIKCATWSRICYIAAKTKVTGNSFILNVSATRGNVVYNDTFAIKSHHSSAATIAKISGSKYGSSIQIRVIADADGDCYVELYDAANSATNSTTQSVNCALLHVACGALTTYTAFTDGTTLPTNFTNAASLTTNSNSLQGNLTWGEITGKPTSMPASDVSSWAKASTKPTYTKSEVGLGNVDNTADANKSVKYATSAGSADSATKATKDSAGQQINTTYIKGLSVSGKTITYTKGDGTTGTITTQDTNTTYSAFKGATSSAAGGAGLVPAPGTANVGQYLKGDGTWGTPTNTTYSDVTTSAHGLMTAADKSKLDGIATGANKYTHPSYTAKTAGFYKVTVDATGHVSAATAVAKADITGLGIPAQDTTYSAFKGATSNATGGSGLVPAPASGQTGLYLKSDGTWGTPTNTTYSDATTSAHGLMTAADKTKLNGIATGANNYTHPAYTARTAGLYKVTVDATGHVSAVAAVTKADITALGIPAQDTNTTYSTGTASASGLTKLYTGTGSATDGTMTQKAITDALNGKSGTGHTHNYAGSSSAGGVANSAAKLATARTVSGGTDITMSYSYDGSANSSASIGYYNSSANNGNTNNYPFHRFAKLNTITGSYVDKTMTVLLTQDYNGGAFGIARISLRTDNVSNKDVAKAEVRWLVRSGFNADAIQIGIYNVAGATYADAFLKLAGSYCCTVIRAIANGARGNISRTWELVNSREVDSTTSSDAKTSTESYANIATAGTKLHNQAYSTTVSGSDSGTTSYANSAGSATKATQDSAGQQINTTYVKGLSVSGRTITYTKGDNTTGTITTQDTTYSDATTSAHGLMTAADKTKLNGIATGANNYSHPTTSGNKHIPAGGSSGQILRWSADGTAVWGADNNTTYSAFKGATSSAAGGAGLVPAPATGNAGQYLRGDGTWATPTNTTYSDATTSAHGLMTAADKSKLNGIAANANNYSHPTSSGNKHIPSGGSSGKILKWSADGTAAWGDVPSDAIPITRAEYKKLLDNKTYDSSKYYYVTDDFDSATVINDSTVTTSTAYSSSKTNTLLASKVNKSSKVSTTLNASSWSGSSAPYTITLSINGVTTSNNVEILIPGSATDAQVEAWMAAGIVNGTQAANSVTLKAYGDKPSINIPIEAIIRND